MNPLEAMARAIFAVTYLNEDWDTAPNAIRLGCLATARAARDALADNVDEKMSNRYLTTPKPTSNAIAAAIRAAEEEK